MWVPLHVHSQYSVLDASAPLGQIVKRAASYGMPAVALTDHGNMYGAVEFYKACKAQGVQPIIGCEVYVAPGSRFEKKKEMGKKTSYHLLLLAKNETGYRNLCKLSTFGFLEGFYYNPRIDKELLAEHSEGLICLSGCMSSELPQEILHGTEESVSEVVRWFHDLFGEDYYFELQRHQMSEEHLKGDGVVVETWLYEQYKDYIAKQTKINDTLIALSQKWNIPLVATNDSHYMDREDWKAHEILLNVQSGEPCEIWELDARGNPKFSKPNPKRRTYTTHECYFKTPEQMQELFSDVPEAIENTLKVSEKCSLALDFETKHYPVFVPPELEGKEIDSGEREEKVALFLRNLCEANIEKRYTKERLQKVQELYPDQEPLTVVRERLERELSVITSKGMCDYLLIVWDFIDWAKKEGIPVGPGRGSGVGSIVLYLIGVTDIEPLRFRLFFERFINPERFSYPDIDVDICMDRRQDVINYTLEKYGKENVAQIITFGTMKAKMAIKDVGRVLSVPLSKVNAIAKLVPDDLNITLEKALEKDPDLKKMVDEDEDAHKIIEFARKLEGCIRNTGIHAAGIIISGRPLVDLIPVCRAKDSEIPVTQFSMKPVEQVGMLKMDFLGLTTLTAIQKSVEAVRLSKGKEIDWVNLSLEDAPTFALLNKGKTLGVFQLESGGMQDLAKNLHLDTFEEIIAVGALYRPGPMDMIPSFISRKHGREKIEYDHPWLEDILAETNGIMVYQEHVIQIASKMANYSLGEGDVLRRAMGKKDLKQMAEQRQKFLKGAADNGISSELATVVFDKMEKFAAYGFNKSHAAAYAYLSYTTAFFKANYPKEWMASLMTCVIHDITKVAKFIRECQAMQVAMLPPDVNEAGEYFVATDKGIRFGMAGIKGVGSAVVQSIVEEREKKGSFESLYQFLKRVDHKKVGKKTVENLVDAGCFDFTDWDRDAMRESIETMYASAAKESKEQAAGVMTLFSYLGNDSEAYFSKPPEIKEPTTKQEKQFREKELLGFFLTGHPMDSYRDVMKKLFCVPLSSMSGMDPDTVFRAAFIVETVQVRFSSRSQKKFAILVIGDGVERFELPIWSQLYEEKGHLLRENQILYAVLQAEERDGEKRLGCRWFDDLTNSSQAMVEECDRAYDRAKSFLSSKFRREKKGEKKVEIKEKPASTVQMVVDADIARLSHIMEIKKLVEANSGEQPLSIEFVSEKRSLAHVAVDARSGVLASKEMIAKLEAVASVKKVDSK